MQTLTKSRLHKFRHVIFDMDGTLFDTAGDILASLQEALRVSGFTEADTSGLRLGPPLDEMIRQAAGSEIGEEALKQVRVAFRDRYDLQDFPRTVAYPGLQSLLEELQKVGCRLHVATNKREFPALRILEVKAVRPFFREILCVDSGGRKWSKTEMILEILHRAEADPRQTILFGDSASDIQAGQAAGIWTAGVLYGYASEQEIMDARPDYPCASLKDLVGNG